MEVIDIPKAAKEGLIKYAPPNIEEVIKLDIHGNSSKFKDERKLREYQQNAISEWISNGYCGIFEMATGTGKTFTALNCMNEIININSRFLIVIACPYAHLAEQWAHDVENNFNIPCYNIYSSVNPNWKRDFNNLILNLELGVTDKAIILTTHKTFFNFFILLSFQVIYSLGNFQIWKFHLC